MFAKLFIFQSFLYFFPSIILRPDKYNNINFQSSYLNGGFLAMLQGPIWSPFFANLYKPQPNLLPDSHLGQNFLRQICFDFLDPFDELSTHDRRILTRRA